MADLLPPNATTMEKCIVEATADMVALDFDYTALSDPYRCPSALLPWLAWTWHVDTWDSGWSDRTKRNVINAAYEVHRKKGSVGAVKRALAAAGFQATIIERLGKRKYDGETLFDGRTYYGWADAWPLYRVVLTAPIRNDQVATVRAILAATAPARNELVSLEYQEAANLYDGRSSYDGAYNYGTV